MIKRLKELLGDSLVYGLGSVLEKVGGFILLLFFANLLTPSDYGVLGLLAYMDMAFEALSSSGMRSAVFREFALADTLETKRRVVNTAIWGVLIGGVIIASIGMVFAPEIAELVTQNRGYANLVRVDFAACIASAVSAIPMLVLQAARRSVPFASINFSKFVLTSATTVFFIVGLKWGVWGPILSVGLWNVVYATFLVASQLREFGFEIHWPTWKRMFTYGFPFMPYRLLAVANTAFSTYMVASLMGVRSAGIYQVAARFALPLGFVVDAITQAWWPYKFRIYKEEKDPANLFRTITTSYLAMTTYLWVGTAIWGPEVLRFAIHRVEYHPAAYVIGSIALARLMIGVYQMFGTGIELGDNAKPIALVSLAGLLVGLGSSFALIPLWGATGAAISASLGAFVMTVVIFQLGQARIRIHHDWPAITAIAIASASCVFAGHEVLSITSFWRRILIDVALSLGYPLLVVLILAASRTQRERMRALYDRVQAIRRKRREPSVA
ncbi:MAG: oligosaccharide flippase family protein [Sandaracinaceae bacterium]|nr:oligosaccharide flippase family protein [Sandaracinaceae bacterium]